MSASTGPSPGVARLLDGSGLDATTAEGTLASEPVYRFDVEHTVGLLATALARLHELPLPVHTPADESVPVLDPAALTTAAREAIGAGRVTTESLSDAYRHMAPERLLTALEETRATSLSTASEAVVLTHGRPLLSRLLCRDGAVIGFVGWDRAALADPYRDLAVAARGVATDLGPMLVPVLVERYATELGRLGGTFASPDPLRLDWYVLAAELTA